MARNYMQDISPPDDSVRKVRSRKPHAPEPEPEEAVVEEVLQEDGLPEHHERSIRNIRPSAARMRYPSREPVEQRHYAPPRRRGRAIGVWVAAIIALLVLGVLAFLILFPSTSVTVVPRTQVVSFDASSPFTAYPEASAEPGTIPYTVLSQTFEDSAVVAASGTEEAEEQARGTITVFNAHSEDDVPLIKNTRFQTPEGLIYRIAESIEIPGKTGTTPGSITVEAFADQAGAEYNVGPVSKFTVPGLRTSDMYEGIYAESKAAFSGGFSGTRPAVTDAVLEAAQAEVRGRLQEKAQQLAATAPEGSIAFPGLLAIRFETLPAVEEGSGSVRITERATVSVPVFKEDRLAQSIGQAVSASAEGQSVTIRFSDTLTAAAVEEIAAADVGVEPVVFTLGGRGQLVWTLSSEELATALAGREEGAFETIIQGFPSVAEARARLMPFWRSSFPEAESIEIIVEEAPTF